MMSLGTRITDDDGWRPRGSDADEKKRRQKIDAAIVKSLEEESAEEDLLDLLEDE